MTLMQAQPKPLRDSAAYEMGRGDAEAGKLLLAPSEFEQAHSSYALTTSTYHYYWRGYTTWHKERNAALRAGVDDPRCTCGGLDAVPHATDHAPDCALRIDAPQEVRFLGPKTYTEACTCGGWVRGYHRHDCGVFGV
jgi:hypothetical protein